MPQITITDLTRCEGGNHYHATVTIDDGKPMGVDFTQADLDREVSAAHLKDLVLFLVARDLKASQRSGKPDIATEKAAVVGKSVDAEIVEVRAATVAVGKG